MKQYLTQEQTAKLIELGFEKPKSMAEYDLPASDWRIGAKGLRPAYSIGELIEVLPKSINVNNCFFTLTISAGSKNGLIEYNDIAFGSQAGVCEAELIDALFAEIVILKEEGVI